LGLQAKQRSLHNNYMTLPVLFMMLSSHFPMVVGHDLNWLLYAGLSAVSILIRHFFNLKHRGSLRWELIGWAAAGGLVIALFASAERSVSAPVPPLAEAGSQAEVLIVRTIVDRHCRACHTAAPTHPAFAEAPSGLVLDTLDAVRLHAGPIYEQVVASELMPLGNETGMSLAERRTLGAWLERADDDDQG
ncbi:MAG: urate hydroxylase PuuD, partial [Caulobacterales bacterium]|nr:urate hydroxylase PuuD [Caulobacterales bacterium]